MADRTPSKVSRTGRLQSKPYDRPTSATATPDRPNRGFLSSVAGLLLSPFSSAKPSRSLEQDSEQPVEISSGSEDAGFSEDTRTQKLKGRQHSEGRMEVDESRILAIQPIQDVLSSLDPIDPLQSIHLINDFNKTKAQLGQQHTLEERRAIDELVRRADTDSPLKHSVSGLRASTSHANLGSPSRLRGRSQFSSGLAKSSSMNFASANEDLTPPSSASTGSDRYQLPGSYKMSKPKPDGLPNSSRDLGGYSRPPQSASELNPASPQVLQKVIGRPLVNRKYAPLKSSGLSKSQSMFSLPKSTANDSLAFPVGSSSRAEVGALQAPTADKAVRQRVDALAHTPTQGKSPSPAKSTSNPARKEETLQKTAAAMELEGLLKVAADEEGEKATPIPSVVNPYENYRFNVGSSTSLKVSGRKALPKRAGGLAGRRAIMEAAEKKEKERQKDQELTDLDLINENLGVETAGKRRRLQSDVPTEDRTSKADSPMQDVSSEKLSKDASPISSAIAKPEQPSRPPSTASFTFGKPGTSTPTAFPSFTVASKAVVKTSTPDTTQKKSDAMDIVMANASIPSTSSSKPTPTIFSAASLTPAATPFALAPTKATSKEPVNPRSPEEEVKTMDKAGLPVFVFKCLSKLPSLVTGTSYGAQQAAKKVEDIKLPSFQFGVSYTPPQSGSSHPFALLANAQSKAPASVAGAKEAWTCELCGLKSSADSTQCDVCEAPKPKAKASAIQQAPLAWKSTVPSTSIFNNSTGSQWTCDLCGLKSSASSTQCDVCEAPKPASKSTTAPATTSATVPNIFSKPTATDKWDCDVCGLKSSAASTQCDVCEAPKPSSAPKATFTAGVAAWGAPVVASTTDSTPKLAPSVGFTGWGSGAFGGNAKAGGGGEWTCGLCGLRSKATSTQCDVCEAPKP